MGGLDDFYLTLVERDFAVGLVRKGKFFSRAQPRAASKLPVD